jgi:predicted nucleic acid-binding protein
MSDLIYSSAVLTMSQTTEFVRNKSVDNTILNLIIQKGLTDFSLDEAYEAIHGDLPLRKEEVWISLLRSLENKTIDNRQDQLIDKNRTRFLIPERITKKIQEQCTELKQFLDDSITELFDGLYTKENKDKYKELLLDVVTKLMAKYGYAYAGQLAGVGDATEFVPLKDLKEICQTSIENSKLSLKVEDLSSAIGLLFDRRDPCLNNLAFSICNRYYISRLIGLDMPVDFIAKNLYEGSKIFLDTNLIMTIVYARSQRHNEFREILKRADEIGIKFAVSEMTLAELHTKIEHYQQDLELGSEIIPEDLLTEVQGQILETGNGESTTNTFNPNDSVHKERLQEMGVEFIPIDKKQEIYTPDDFQSVKDDIAFFDRKYRRMSLAKNENALFHDTYLYFLIDKYRKESDSVSAWFLTLDNSVIEHGISTKKEEQPPYSIRLFSLLQTLSQFVESQALKGEFSDLFGELVSKDLLPRDKMFSIDDLKLLIGFDIRAKEIPPEFVRKATLHIKKNILKGGQITEKNKSEAIHEFTKFLATPEQNFVEIIKKYDKKLKDRDDDLKLKDREIFDYKAQVESKLDIIGQLNLCMQELELDNAKEKYSRAKEKYESNLAAYVQIEQNTSLKKLSSTRKRYVWLIIFSLIFFTGINLIEPLSKYFENSIDVQNWLKYILALILFLIPFIRSFFEHKLVILSFKVLLSKNMEKYLREIEINSQKTYNSIHPTPKLDDYVKQ